MLAKINMQSEQNLINLKFTQKNIKSSSSPSSLSSLIILQVIIICVIQMVSVCQQLQQQQHQHQHHHLKLKKPKSTCWWYTQNTTKPANNFNRCCFNRCNQSDTTTMQSLLVTMMRGRILALMQFSKI